MVVARLHGEKAYVPMRGDAAKARAEQDDVVVVESLAEIGTDPLSSSRSPSGS